MAVVARRPPSGPRRCQLLSHLSLEACGLYGMVWSSLTVLSVVSTVDHDGFRLTDPFVLCLVFVSGRGFGLSHFVPSHVL